MNINEEIKRMRSLMGLNENIQNSNFADMGIDKKSVSRGGVMYQEQDMVGGVDLSKPFEPTGSDPKSEFEQEVEEKKDEIEQDVMDYRREVAGKKEDAEDDEGTPVMQMYANEELVVHLVKSVQQLTRAHNHLIAAITGSTDLNQLKASVTGSLIG